MKRAGVFVAFVAAMCVSATAAAQVGKGLIDPNTAGEKELMTVPQFNEKVAKAIVGKRPFLSQTDYNKFLLGQGLTADQLKESYARTFVHLNLNSAPAEEILMIPNLGKRMLHEFQEDRPYETLARFRREMGKYHDDKEVARLERYVTIK